MKWTGDVSYFDDDYSTFLRCVSQGRTYQITTMLYGKSKIWTLEYLPYQIWQLGGRREPVWETILEADSMADCIEYAKEHEFLEKLKA